MSLKVIIQSNLHKTDWLAVYKSVQGTYQSSQLFLLDKQKDKKE